MQNLSITRLSDAKFSASPHFDDRPNPAMVDLIVVHCVSLPEGDFESDAPRKLFTGCLDCETHPSFADLEGLEVSPHLLIDRNGDIEQFVEFDKRAWHAGESRWRGRSRCNDHSIGIELVGCVSVPFTAAQYRTLAETILALFEAFPHLGPDCVVGHQQIAPARKFDPGPCFDWRQLFTALV